jgi:serine/threonine-protein kinase
MSPEQALLAAVDGRTDIYSVGVILMEMTAGMLPIRKEPPAEMIKRKRTAPETFFSAKPSEVNPAINCELEAIIYKAIAPLPDHRFADCQEFKAGLEAYIRKHGLN